MLLFDPEPFFETHKSIFFTIDKIVPFFYSLADGETPLIEDEEEDALLESQEFEEKVSILNNKVKIFQEAKFFIIIFTYIR